MSRLVRIVTHHTNRDLAAELWRKLGVASIGWRESGDMTRMSKDEIVKELMGKRSISKREAKYAASQLETFRDQVRPGDCIIAYRTGNYVALVGKVLGGYYFNTSNEIGDPNGSLKHGSQKKVDWFSQPRNFHRSNFQNTSLPELVEWVALRGTVYYRDYPDNLLARVCKEIQQIPNGAGPVSAR